MGRNTRSFSLFSRLFNPMGFGFGSVRFNTPGAPAAGAADPLDPAEPLDPANPVPPPAPAGGPAPAPQPAPAPAPAPRYAPDPEAVRRRKRAMGAVRYLVRLLGGDPEKIKILGNGSPSDPYRVEGDDDFNARLQAAQTAAGAVQPGSPGNPRRPAPVVDTAAVTAEMTALRTQSQALTDYVRGLKIVE